MKSPHSGFPGRTAAAPVSLGPFFGLLVLFAVSCSPPGPPVTVDLIEHLSEAKEVETPSILVRENVSAPDWVAVPPEDLPQPNSEWQTEIFLEGDASESGLELLQDDVPVARAESIPGRPIPSWRIEREGTRWGPVGLEVNLYLAGTKKVRVPAVDGPARIRLLARGTPIDGESPQLRLSLDGEESGRLVIDATEETYYETMLHFPEDPAILELSVANDWCEQNPPCGNVELYEITIETPTVISLITKPRASGPPDSVALRYRPASSLRAIEDGTAISGKTPTSDPGSLVLGGVSIGDEARPTLFLPPPSRLVYPLTVPEDAVLEFWVAARPGNGSEWGHGTVRWSFRSDGGDEDLLLELHSRPDMSPADQRWIPVEVPLTQLAGRSGSLVLETAVRPKENEGPRDPPEKNLTGMCIGNPRVTSAPKGTAGRPHPSPDVVIVSIDTLRSDHLSCYGYGRKTSPNVDRVAGESVLFEQCYSTSSWTLPAHASLFASLMPSSHAVNSYTNSLVESPDVLGSWFRGLGYRTGGFVDGIMLSAEYGFHHGFDIYRDRNEGIEKILPHALDWWDRQPPGIPRMLFLHCYDVHEPYGSAEEFRLKFHPDASYDRLPFLFETADIARLVEGVRTGNLKVLPEDLEHVRALYDGDIYFTDQQIGFLFEHLQSREEWDDALLILLSDHGEEFAEHGTFQHGRNVYEEVVHVPLIIKLPGGEFAGLRVQENVSLIDILPTIADLLNGPTPDTWQGQSLYPHIRKPGEPPGHSVFVEHQIVANRDLMKEIAPDYSFIVGFDDLETPVEEELYNRETDPQELKDISGEQPELVEDWTREIIETRQGFRERGRASSDVRLDAETVERLRNMGYFK